jgi:hypothetical protein
MNESLNNSSQVNPSDEEWEKTMQDFMGNFGKKKEVESTPRYEYRATDVEDVIQNAEEYIIPECLEACKILWGKNIETIMCSNYSDNTDLYIDLLDGDGLSAENRDIFINNEGNGFALGEEHDYPRISVPGQTPESALKLQELADKLKIQDVRSCRYKSSAEFLEEYKYGNMPIEYDGVDEFGNVSVRRQYNPERTNITLQDALEQTGKSSLYVPPEDRVYESQMFLDWHNRYLNFHLNI